MPNYKVKGEFCLEIEDAESKEAAIQAALDQLGDCFCHYPAETALDVKAEEIVEDPDADRRCDWCGEVLDYLVTDWDVILEWSEDGVWSIETIRHYAIRCPNCRSLLSEETLDRLRVPSELR